MPLKAQWPTPRTPAPLSRHSAPQVASWLVASTLGGCVGFGLMAHPAVASNPYALAAALCACAFAVGLLGSSQFRVTM